MFRSLVRILPGLEMAPKHLVAGVSAKAAPAPVYIIAAPMSSQSVPEKNQFPIKTQRVTKNLELWSVPGQDPNANTSTPRLAIILGWMMARKKHLANYGEFYFQQGFDVLCAQISPMELLFPEKGSMVIAGDILDFLLAQERYQNVVTHGFSVGCYLYGECLVHLRDNPEKYGTLLNRLRGQIFDSAVDYYGIPKGLPAAMTENKVLRKTLELTIRTHLKVFESSVNSHYLRASESARTHNPNKAPALFLFSKTDAVGTVGCNLELVRLYEQRGVQVFAKCWENSPHVMHFQRHRDEYLEQLCGFLEGLGLLNVPHRRAAVTGSKL